MRIAIEAQRIFRKDKHGMDFVILETLKELQKRKDGNEYYVFVAPGEDWCLEESENLHIIELRCPTYPLWEQIALPQAVRKLKADLLHCTSNTAPLWCPVPLVLTLHDIIYLEPRQHRSPSFYQEMGWHYRRLIVPRILKKARNIITVSQFECTRIREALQLPKEVIKAVYNGYSAYFTMQETPDESIVQKYIPHPDFLFFLGNTDPKKNAARTLKAYALYLKASQTKRPLLIADLKEEYIDQLLQQEGITGIKEHLYYPGYIGNKDLATLYNAAFAFLYFAASTIAGDDDDEEEEGGKTKIKFAPLAVFCTFFVAELGDKTQLTAITFGANEGMSAALIVWIGCSLGLFAADILGMLVGYLLKSKTPDGLLNTLAFVIFSVFGVYTLYQGLKLIGASVCPIPVWPVLIAATVVFAVLCVCLFIRREKKAK